MSAVTAPLVPCWMAQRTNTAAGFLPSLSAILFTVLSCCSPMAPVHAVSTSMLGKSVMFPNLNLCNIFLLL